MRDVTTSLFVKWVKIFDILRWELWLRSSSIIDNSCLMSRCFPLRRLRAEIASWWCPWASSHWGVSQMKRAPSSDQTLQWCRSGLVMHGNTGILGMSLGGRQGPGHRRATAEWTNPRCHEINWTRIYSKSIWLQIFSSNIQWHCYSILLLQPICLDKFVVAG